MPVCTGCTGWEAAWAVAWGVITIGVCCGAVTAMAGAAGPFWKSEKRRQREKQDVTLSSRQGHGELEAALLSNLVS